MKLSVGADINPMDIKPTPEKIKAESILFF